MPKPASVCWQMLNASSWKRKSTSSPTMPGILALYPVTLDCGSKKLAELRDKDFYVTKMKFAKKGDKSTVIYNHAITIKDIPLTAYEYVVNGKPTLEWVMERQAVSAHKV